MYLILALLGIAAIWGVYYGLKLLLRFIFYEMAKQDLLFTLRTEGEIKAIMEGDRCVRYVMRVENHIIDPDDFDIFKGDFEEYGRHLKKIADALEAEGKEKNPEFKFREEKLKPGTDRLTAKFEKRLRLANPTKHSEYHWVERWFGVTWIGFPPYRVFTYDFRWIKYSQKKKTGETASMEVAMHPKDEKVDSLFFRYPAYGIIVDDAETGAGTLAQQAENMPERIQLKLEMVMETETVNPQKTLFRTAGLSSAGDWLSAVTREIRDLVRPWVGEKDYDTFIKDKTWARVNLDRIRDRINGFTVSGEPYDYDGAKETKPTVSSIKHYGQRIVKISLVNVGFKDEKLQAAIDKIFAAEQDVRAAEKEQKAEITRAKGKRATEAASLLGKSDGLKAIAEIPGGKEMYIYEQIGNINVFAPGASDKLLLNISTDGAGKTSTPAKEKGDGGHEQN